MMRLQSEQRLPLKQPSSMLLTDLRALLVQCRRSKVRAIKQQMPLEHALTSLLP